MATITMNEITHAAVRRDLARMEAALGGFQEGDRERARDLRRAWASLWELLHMHHHSEDTHIWPYLRSLGTVDPALADTMEAEHVTMAEAMTAATDAIDQLVATPTRGAADAAAERVSRAAEVTNRHLEHEEQEVMPIIVERMETPEWKAVEKKLRKPPSISIGGRFFAWVQDGIDDENARALRSYVPRPVLWGLSRIAGRAYYRDVAPVWR
ncbi:hemerythrin domain-containing protein [Nocardioides sp.]|uniref:hemerythrin domain-containing protein n=1 Tax=Nocardioides sp. TaxID=35761 RepID=UPI002ED1E98D